LSIELEKTGFQVSSPVLWQGSIQAGIFTVVVAVSNSGTGFLPVAHGQEMMKNGITEFYECGPMKQLKAEK